MFAAKTCLEITTHLETHVFVFTSNVTNALFFYTLVIH